MKMLVLLLLPLGACLIAEENPASKWTNRMDAAQLSYLKRTAASQHECAVRPIPQSANERPQLQRRHEKPMAIFLEVATSARKDTNRLSLIDPLRKPRIKAIDGLGDILAPCRFLHPTLKSIHHHDQSYREIPAAAWPRGQSGFQPHLGFLRVEFVLALQIRFGCPQYRRPIFHAESE
jgi:hypothetical protein